MDLCKSWMDGACRGGRVTYCRVTSALQGQMIRHLRSRRAQKPERESTPKTTSRGAGIRNFRLPPEKPLEVKLQDETSPFIWENISRVKDRRSSTCSQTSPFCLGDYRRCKNFESDLLFAPAATHIARVFGSSCFTFQFP